MTVTIPSGEQGQGQVAARVDQGRPDDLHPDRSLALGTTYVAKVAMGAKAASGDEGTAVDYVWTFTTVSTPAIKQTKPTNGERQG